MPPLITELQVFYRRLDTEKVESINVPPDNPESTAAIKLQVAKIVKQLRDGKNAEYYYVVLKVRKTTGEDGYRTIVPKTLL